MKHVSIVSWALLGALQGFCNEVGDQDDSPGERLLQRACGNGRRREPRHCRELDEVIDQRSRRAAAAGWNRTGSSYFRSANKGGFDDDHRASNTTAS